MLLGCIGDDFTGSSDIANTLAKGGMAVTQFNGIPNYPAAHDVEAGVVSLKSRTQPVDTAVKQSLEAAAWLLEQGCQQLFFKYCSTFDSTRDGNIGPVADALVKLTGAKHVVFCPAFPATGRSVYQGNLFVNDQPLHESGMKDHPLTPMTDSDLRRWLGYQTDVPVNHLPFAVVNKGPTTIASYMESSADGYFIADAITDENLIALGKAVSTHKLVTGGSGMALGLPANFRKQGKLSAKSANWTGVKGTGVILSGSCSEATRRQIAVFECSNPSLELTAKDVFNDIHTAETVGKWVLEQDKTPLVYTSADPAQVREAQEQFGRDNIADKIERLFGELAIYLVQSGTKRVVAAGGETSGAIVTALEIDAMQIGPEIAAGVPALRVDDRDLTLALKSGNFGDDNFFEKALEILGK